MISKKQDVRYRLARLSNTNNDLSKQWVVVYYLWSEEQQKLMRCRVVVKGDTIQARQKDAAQVIKDINRQLKDGATYIDKTDTPLPPVEKPVDVSSVDGKSDMLAAIDFFLTIKKRSLKKNSHKTYRSSLKLFTTYLTNKNLWRSRLNQFSITQANHYMDYVLMELKLSNKSFNKHLGTMETLFNFYIQRGQLKTNPFGLVKKLPERPGKHTAFTPEQVAKVKQACELMQDAQLWLFINFIYYSLARPQSELRLLKVGDVLEHTIRIDAENAKNNRTAHVSIPPPLERLIQQHRIREYPLTDYVFTIDGKPGPKPAYEKYFYNQHRRVLTFLKMENLAYDLYGWKHTGVIALYRATKDIKLVQRQCRHGSLDQTDKYLRDLGLFLNDNQFQNLEGI